MVSIAKQGLKLHPGDLEALEKRLGLHLPQTYRRFLLETNGGVPIPGVVDVARLPGSPTDVQVFFGISREAPTSNLEWNFGLLPDQHSDKRLLAIACDSGGNLFCIETGSGEGGVHYCAISEDGALFAVAPTFDAFLAKLRDY